MDTGTIIVGVILIVLYILSVVITEISRKNERKNYSGFYHL
jgi:hypothetical protein